eukprot:GSA120T00020573001.1
MRTFGIACNAPFCRLRSTSTLAAAKLRVLFPHRDCFWRGLKGVWDAFSAKRARPFCLPRTAAGRQWLSYASATLRTAPSSKAIVKLIAPGGNEAELLRLAAEVLGCLTARADLVRDLDAENSPFLHVDPNPPRIDGWNIGNRYRVVFRLEVLMAKPRGRHAQEGSGETKALEIRIYSSGRAVVTLDGEKHGCAGTIAMWTPSHLRLCEKGERKWLHFWGVPNNAEEYERGLDKPIKMCLAYAAEHVGLGTPASAGSTNEIARCDETNAIELYILPPFRPREYDDISSAPMERDMQVFGARSRQCRELLCFRDAVARFRRRYSCSMNSSMDSDANGFQGFDAANPVLLQYYYDTVLSEDPPFDYDRTLRSYLFPYRRYHDYPPYHEYKREPDPRYYRSPVSADDQARSVSLARELRSKSAWLTAAYYVLASEHRRLLFFPEDQGESFPGLEQTSDGPEVAEREKPDGTDFEAPEEDDDSIMSDTEEFGHDASEEEAESELVEAHQASDREQHTVDFEVKVIIRAEDAAGGSSKIEPTKGTSGRVPLQKLLQVHVVQLRATTNVGRHRPRLELLKFL